MDGGVDSPIWPLSRPALVVFQYFDVPIRIVVTVEAWEDLRTIRCKRPISPVDVGGIWSGVGDHVNGDGSERCN